MERFLELILSKNIEEFDTNTTKRERSMIITHSKWILKRIGWTIKAKKQHSICFKNNLA